MTNGPLMSLKLGQITTVVISSATMAKEVLQTHDQLLSNRSIPDAIRAHKQQGLPWIPLASRWRNIRKICNSQLFAHKILNANQNIQRKKVQELLADVHKSCLTNDADDIGRAALKTTLNLLSNTICSVDLADLNSDMAREFKELVWNIMEEVGKPSLADYFPVLRKDLFIAGNDTTSATLEWTMAELIQNPEVILKAKEELNQIIGKGNPVKESDISRLPYLQAIVRETFRLHPPVPLLLPRKAEADVEIQGFKVPKGAQVLVNAWAISKDSSIWENPNSLKLERFMGSEIDVKGRNLSLFRLVLGAEYVLVAIGDTNVTLDVGFAYSHI
ncbi:hypothetical protein ACJW30_10G055600 [Castanea mollissima]